MSDANTREQAIVQLDWNVAEGHVTVTPQNKDRYVITMRRAVEACQAMAEAEGFKLEVQVLQQRLAEWMATRGDVRDAYLTVRDGRFLFLVVRERAEYDAEFEDSLSALDLEIANDRDLEQIRLDAMGLPPVSPEALESFLNPRIALAYRGQRA